MPFIILCVGCFVTMVAAEHINPSHGIEVVVGYIIGLVAAIVAVLYSDKYGE